MSKIVWLIITTTACSLIAISAPTPAIAADNGSCVYRIHSKVYGRSFKVCQTATSESACGVWQTSKGQYTRAKSTAKEMAYVANRVAFSARESCATAKAVGVCQLPTSMIYFLEGSATDLAYGCSRMKGKWKPLGREQEGEEK